MPWPFSPLCRFETALVGFGKFQTPVDAGQEPLADEPTRVPEQEKQPPHLNTADWLRRLRPEALQPTSTTGKNQAIPVLSLALIAAVHESARLSSNVRFWG
jgi:hypothetical protein